MFAPRSMNDDVRSRSKTQLRLMLYLTATARSGVVDMGANLDGEGWGRGGVEVGELMGCVG